MFVPCSFAKEENEQKCYDMPQQTRQSNTRSQINFIQHGIQHRNESIKSTEHTVRIRENKLGIIQQYGFQKTSYF